MIGAVKRRAHQVVHSRVHHNEILLLASLHVENSRQQNPRFGDQGAARLQNQPVRLAFHAAREFGHKSRHIERLFIRVANPQAAAQIEELHRNADLAQGFLDP